MPVVIEESQTEDHERKDSHPYEETPPRQHSPPRVTYEKNDENDGNDKINDDKRSPVQPKKARERSNTLAARDVDESNSDVPASGSRRPPILLRNR